jgi:DNA-binding transcriptional regulator YdaS (Cro superfamily)
MKAIERAVQSVHPPTQAELARRLQVRGDTSRPTPQEVNRWLKRGWAAPKYAPLIERETGVTCIELVRDIPDRHGH